MLEVQSNNGLCLEVESSMVGHAQSAAMTTTLTLEMGALARFLTNHYHIKGFLFIRFSPSTTTKQMALVSSKAILALKTFS